MSKEEDIVTRVKIFYTQGLDRSYNQTDELHAAGFNRVGGSCREQLWQIRAGPEEALRKLTRTVCLRPDEFAIL